MNKDLLYRFFCGIASDDEVAQIRQWLSASAGNKRKLLSERKLFDLMILHADEHTTDVRSVRRRRVVFIRRMVGAAALAATVLIASYFLFRPHNLVESLPSMQTVSVPAGQRVNITLPDGTNVWLNARSRLTYPTSFNLRERTLELDGEAYFEVSRDDQKPFAVQTERGIIEVLGTQFNVDAYAGGVFETTLMSGSLKVCLNDRSAGDVLLTPHEKAVLKDGKLHVERVDDYARYRWRDGLICFTNASFSDIMNDFEKYYGVPIQVKNPKMMRHAYTGKFRLTDGVDYALRVLQKDVRFAYRHDDNKQIIYIE